MHKILQLLGSCGDTPINIFIRMHTTSCNKMKFIFTGRNLELEKIESIHVMVVGSAKVIP